MFRFKEWLHNHKKRDKKNEQRGSQTYGEIGDFNQQGKATGSDPQVTQQTVHVFPVAEL